jgi:hypothetical protein
MKVFTFSGLLILSAIGVQAQPVRDILDAQEAVRAHARDMQPALDQVKELAQVLNMFANVQRTLTDEPQAYMAFDKVIRDIDEYTVPAARRNAPLDRETRAAIESTRRLIEGARNGAPYGSLADLREKIHHNTIHALQRRALQMNRQVEAIVRVYEGMATQFRTATAGNIANLERLAIDPEKQ